MPIPRDPGLYAVPSDAKPNTKDLLPLNEYAHIIVSFSGGKDSTALVLKLVDLGVPLDRIELWHQSIDGLPGDPRFFDWPCTEAYVEAFARTLGVKLYHQARIGGVRGELFRENARTAPTVIELGDGSSITRGGTTGDLNTRLRFPAKSQNMGIRWCTGKCKIDPSRMAFANDPRFEGSNTVFLTGERRQESGGRSKYAMVQDYASAPTKGRRVDHWRAVLNWTEEQVWEILARYRIRPHPAYYLGWSRLSCICCIYGDEDQWASIAEINPTLMEELARLEELFHDYWAVRLSPGHRYHQERRLKPYMGTIWPGGQTVWESARKGVSYLRTGDAALIRLAMAEGSYPEGLIRLDLSEQWELPRGAFAKSGGPT